MASESFSRFDICKYKYSTETIQSLQSQKEIGDLPDDIFKRNMLDRYVDRPDESFCNGRYGVLNKFCYVEFLRFYYIVPSANENSGSPWN